MMQNKDTESASVCPKERKYVYMYLISVIAKIWMLLTFFSLHSDAR